MMQIEQCNLKTLNLGTQNPEVSIEEVVKICFKVAGKSLKINAMSSTPGSPTRRAPNMTLTNKLLNYASNVSLSDGIERTFTWYRKNVFESDKESAK